MDVKLYFHNEFPKPTVRHDKIGSKDGILGTLFICSLVLTTQRAAIYLVQPHLIFFCPEDQKTSVVHIQPYVQIFRHLSHYDIE